MGADIALGLLILSSLYVQPAATAFPVAYAAEPIVEIPAQVILKVPPPRIPPILEKVAFCESGGSQFDKYGNVKRGIVDKRDIGKWQINTFYWGEEARRLGYDIWTLEGNTAMALHIYKKAGLQPWSASKSCWVVAS